MQDLQERNTFDFRGNFSVVIYFIVSITLELIVLFNEYGLNLIFECNKITVYCLDITPNSLDETCTPYQKPEKSLQYIQITRQTSLSQFQLQLKQDFQTTYQTKQFFVK